MLALLLALVAPQGGSLIIDFGAAGSVRVGGLTPQDDERVYHDPPLMSPRGDAAALRFCHDFAKYQPCTVYLARPGRPVLTLKNSDVERLLWSTDGQYLIGAGENTVRLWNLVGGMRTAVPTPGQVYARLTRHSSRIVGLTFRDRHLCVRTQDQWYEPNGQQAGRSVSVTRYTLPTLRPLEVLSFSAQEQAAPCALPHTKP